MPPTTAQLHLCSRMALILQVQVPGTWHISALGATVSIFNLTGSLEHPEVLCLDKGSAFILDCIAGAPTVGTGIKWPLLELSWVLLPSQFSQAESTSRTTLPHFSLKWTQHYHTKCFP